MKNRKKIECFEKEFEALSVEELVVIAQEEYKHFTEDSARMKAALMQRRRKLNENFEWTAENKERLLLLNAKLMDSFEKLKTETTKVFQHLKKRLNTTDDFVQDFYIEAFVKPYNEAESDSIEEILRETWNETCLHFFLFPNESVEEALCDIHFKRDLNWNDATPQLRGHFDEHYICYAIHVLFDHILEWSYSDILNINRLMAEYRVTCQNFKEKF